MSDDFEAVFRELRTIMLRHAAGMTVARDLPGELVVRTQAKTLGRASPAGSAR
jgi:hypothetical protein